MKKKCKNIDITDWQTVLPWVRDCIMRHKKRYDFKSLLIRHGVSKEDYYSVLSTHDYTIFDEAIIRIAKEACEGISNRELNLPPVRIRMMTDTTTGKIRPIGKESAMQQVYDHIAVHSCDEIFNARMVDQQMSSIKGRGQIAGVRLIRKYIMKDNRAMAFARKHGIRYASKCKYFVKLDIEKCYPNADMEIFMKILEHDCANEDILWLWRTLMESHHVEGYTGFMIGALPSQWACQTMLSFVYRKAMSLIYRKRGKTFRKVNAMVMFMDDMLMTGSNRKQLLSAIRELIAYTADHLGFQIKQTFAIKELARTGIDMMGFVIYRNGKVEMRERNYIKSRRMMKRFIESGRLVYPQAQRLNSFKGFYKHSDSKKVCGELKAWKIFTLCSLVISKCEKEGGYDKNILRDRARPDFVPATG